LLYVQARINIKKFIPSRITCCYCRGMQLDLRWITEYEDTRKGEMEENMIISILLLQEGNNSKVLKNS
jgi:hypothetical protein